MSSSSSASSKVDAGLLGFFPRGARLCGHFGGGGGGGGGVSDSESDPESEDDIVEFQDVDTFACWKLGTWKTVPVLVFQWRDVDAHERPLLRSEEGAKPS